MDINLIPVIGQCIVALDFVNSALSDKLPLRFFLLTFCGLSRAVRSRVPNARSLHRRPVANRGTASDRRVIHLPRKVIALWKKKKMSRGESCRETGEGREKNNEYFRPISRTLLERRGNRSPSDKVVYLRRNNCWKRARLSRYYINSYKKKILTKYRLHKFYLRTYFRLLINSFFALNALK